MSAARSSRFLLFQHHQYHDQHISSPQPQPPPEPAESDVIVILAALICALICVVGLALVARCAWLRRSFSGRSSSSDADQLPTASVAITPPPNKGVKKKVLRSLPKLSYDQAFPPPGHPSSVPPTAKLSSECPICLAEFVAGDEIRVLPHCGHGFHVACVDTWLGAHSSCPSCRQILLVGNQADRRCRKCGASAGAGASSGGPNGNQPSSSSAAAAAAAAAGEARAKDREDRDAGRFLP